MDAVSDDGICKECRPIFGGGRDTQWPADEFLWVEFCTRHRGLPALEILQAENAQLLKTLTLAQEASSRLVEEKRALEAEIARLTRPVPELYSCDGLPQQ
jgi:hypothetical protein